MENWIYDHRLGAEEYRLQVIQQPEFACAYGVPRKIDLSKLPKMPPKEENGSQTTTTRPKDPKYPLYPPPVIELVTQQGKTNNIFNSNPNLFAYATLYAAREEQRDIDDDELIGSSCTTLQRIFNKPHPQEQGLFVFPDIHVKKAGRYFLRFDMLELVIDGQTGLSHAVQRCSTSSSTFHVFSKPSECPTREKLSDRSLTSILSEMGVKMKIRPKTEKRKKKTETWDSNLREEAASSNITNRPKKRSRPNVAQSHPNQAPTICPGFPQYYPTMPQHYPTPPHASMPYGVLQQPGQPHGCPHLPVDLEFMNPTSLAARIAQETMDHYQVYGQVPVYPEIGFVQFPQYPMYDPDMFEDPQNPHNPQNPQDPQEPDGGQ